MPLLLPLGTSTPDFADFRIHFSIFIATFTARESSNIQVEGEGPSDRRPAFTLHSTLYTLLLL